MNICRKHSALWFTFILLIVNISCQRHGKSLLDLKQFLDKKEKMYEEISIAYGDASWHQHSESNESDVNQFKEQFRTLFNNDTLQNYISDWYKRKQSIEDDTLRRRVELWHHILTASYVNLDPVILTTQNELEKWIASPDRGSKSNSEMEGKAIQLLALRNEKAQERGFTHYAELVLKTTGIEPSWFLNLVTTIDSLTLPIYEAMITDMKQEKDKETIGFESIQSLYINYYFSRQGPQVEFNESLDLIQETVENIGFRWDSLAIQVIEKELPDGLVGEGTTIKIPGDFRAIFTPNLGFKNRLHEIGHGMQLLFTDIRYPILKGYYWCMGGDNAGYSEAMADVIARFSENIQWRRKHINPDEKKDPGHDLTAMAAYLRFQLVTMMFEWELYKDLSQNLADLNAKLMEKYLLIDVTEPQPPSLASVIFVSYPMYLYSYTVSEILSWQVHKSLEKQIGVDYVFNPNTSQFLVNKLYRDGELYHWQNRLKRATGEKLDVFGYIQAHGF